MKYFDQIQLDSLSRWETNFHSAIYADYSRPLTKVDIDFMRSLYHDAYGEDIRVVYTCGRCVLSFLKMIGKWYYESKDKVGVEIQITKQEQGAKAKESAKRNREMRKMKQQEQ